MKSISLLTCTVLLSAVSAQSTSVTPRGIGTEGNDWWSFMFGPPISRWQQLDGTVRGAPIPNINRIEFRQDGSAGFATAVARTVQIEMIMAHTAIASATTVFNSNYRGAQTTVIPRAPVNLPAFNTVPATIPAPWSINLPFATNFSYDGVQDLLWEIRVDGSSLGGFASYPQDFHANRTQNFVTSTLRGAGCTTPNGAWLMTPSSYADTTGLLLSYESIGGPPLANAVVLVGATDPNLPIPGLCANLRTDALLTIPMGAALNAGGYLLMTPRRVPWSASYANAVLYTQLVAADPSQSGLGVALSEGRREILPPYLATTLQVRAYHTDSSLTTPVGTLWSGGFVARFTH